MGPGEKWAYRARKHDPLVEVEVLRLGAKKPPRVLVRFVADAFEGQQEWVPTARLKAPWEYVGELETREKRWDAVTDPGLPRDDPRDYAAEIVFNELIPDDLASFGYASGGGVVKISDLAGLAAFLSVPAELLTSHPASFIECDLLIAPWETTELIVSTAARNHPRPVLLWVDGEERRAGRESNHGARRGGRSSDFVSAEDCLNADEKLGSPVRSILRRWCSEGATVEFDELAALRREIRRVDLIAQEAIEILARSETAAAARLRVALAE